MRAASCEERVASSQFDSGPRPLPLDPRPRRGISLTEVLIAMGIMTVGLLGVAALIPVGGWYVQKAGVADRGSAIAQSVMSDLVTRGMLNPNSWYVMVPKPLPNPVTAPGLWNSGFPSDGKYTPAAATPKPKAGSFTRPFAIALSEALSQPTGAPNQSLLTQQFGAAYVIDPLGVSVMAARNGGVATQPYVHGPAALFPASAYQGFWHYKNYSNLWSQLWANDYTWPIRRVTFREVDTNWDVNTAIAENLFRGSDDLATELPQRADRPAMQKWESTTVGNSQLPLARQWIGDYSWIVTVAPTSNAARNGMASNPESYAYDVSVVVFYKRPLTESIESIYPSLGTSTQPFLSAMGANERVVRAQVISTGISGGELLLTDWGDYTDAGGQKFNAFEGLKVGQWLMMCGPHPNTTSTDPRFVLNWYQVLSIDKEGAGLAKFDATRQRVVALRGPQWPWQPLLSFSTADQGTETAKLSDNLCVTICRGAVAVHTKTMSLESSLGSTAPVFGNPGM